MPGANVLNIRDWRSRLQKREPMLETTPLEIAAALEGAAQAAFNAVGKMDRIDRADRELKMTLLDCEALSHLGRYYAAKIRGACSLALYDSSSDKHEQSITLRHLTEALTHWKAYATTRDAHYVPALYNRLGYVDITALTEQAAADLEIAREWKPGSIKGDGKRAGSEKGFRP